MLSIAAPLNYFVEDGVILIPHSLPSSTGTEYALVHWADKKKMQQGSRVTEP